MKVVKEDKTRLELLRNLMVDFLHGKEEFSCMPYKIKSLYSMLDTLQDDEKQRIFEFWGEFEQIYAGILFYNRSDPTEDEKKEINKISKEAKEYCDFLLKKYPPEPEDPYAWPFEEYK